MINNAKLNQPSTIAVVPTPLRTLPLPKSWAMMEAATDAVCCQRTETSTNIDAMNIMASAIWETGRDGNGLTSRSLPAASSSSCHPGKVARSRRQINANMIAMMLSLVRRCGRWGIRGAYIKYGNTIISLNWLASQIKFRGSCDSWISFANAVALLLHSHDPPSGLMQIPKYPTLAANTALPAIFDIATWALKSTCAVEGTGGYCL